MFNVHSLLLSNCFSSTEIYHIGLVRIGSGGAKSSPECHEMKSDRDKYEAPIRQLSKIKVN